jgi:hypothetical protein
VLLRLPTSLPEAQECLTDGAIPVGGATLVWAAWQRDGFPEQAVSLREVPEANVLGAGEVGAAVLLHRIDERVPEVLHRAASGVGTGAVRRAATVGGNIVGSTLRCLLPAALVLDAHAQVLAAEGPFEADLAELLAKKPLLLSLRWRDPLVSGYRRRHGRPRGRPPGPARRRPRGLRVPERECALFRGRGQRARRVERYADRGAAARGPRGGPGAGGVGTGAGGRTLTGREADSPAAIRYGPDLPGEPQGRVDRWR